MRYLWLALVVPLAVFALRPVWLSRSNDDIRRLLMRQSVEAYLATGRTCPCPYSLNEDGRHCVGRSDYLRPGGSSVLCYPDDVTDSMVLIWKASH